ncbi:MAG TPA: type II secretion system protein N [Candidatus Competibacter sp.]|nr:type II secretion system protein N [Candidatus Competibacter sp.]
MKRALGYGLLGLAAFLLFLLLRVPANLVTGQVGTRLSDFSVQDVEGTATEGTMLGARWRGARIERLTWRWRPLALLLGRLEFNLSADDPEIKLIGNAAMGLGRQVHFRDLAGRLPLSRLGNLAGNLPLQGTVEFALPELDLGATGRPLAARGTVRLLNLRTALNPPTSIGDFVVQLDSTSTEGVRGKIKDNNGPLVLDGTLGLLPDGRYRFDGQAAVRDAANQSLRQAMSLLGPPGSDGRWTLNFSGALAP